MSNAGENNWSEANQRYLMAALAVVRYAIESASESPSKASGDSSGETSGCSSLDSASIGAKASVESALQEAAELMPGPPALETLAATFGLSPFERGLLLLCAGPELDSKFAACCALAQGDPARLYPTFSLALAALPEAHWSALSPSAPLRKWRLIEVGSGHALTICPLRIDERVLHYLTGVQYIDDRLAGLVEPVMAAGEITPSHRNIVERGSLAWSRANTGTILPAIQLCGPDAENKRSITAAICASLGLRLSVMQPHSLPLGPAEMDGLIRLWERESVLGNSALLIECGDIESGDSARERLISRFIDAIKAPIIISCRERRRSQHRVLISFDVHKPTAREQRDIWKNTLGEHAQSLNGHVDALVSQFSLSPRTIRAAAIEAVSAGSFRNGEFNVYDDVNEPVEQQSFETVEAQAEAGEAEVSEAEVSDAETSEAETFDAETSEVRTDHTEAGGGSYARLSDLLWDACRVQARAKLDGLAQHIEAAAGWNDLVLPDAQRLTLLDVATHVKHRATVYDAWGFGSKGARGLGISALFAGASGTGKTMAAEVLARELRLDLYRIDLSSVVSKYIGETEKNLRLVFDAAEEGGAILLFDEADALFGKRSEVKDSHDRYANIEVSYLLQRMETYRGLAILTTNLKNALDTAFLRRIRFIVQFPFPDAPQRREIWRRIFPADTPIEGLDYDKLARLNVAGGNIRNIALNAAFLAADVGSPIRMRHLLQAARAEYAKLEKPVTEAEIGGWM